MKFNRNGVHYAMRILELLQEGRIKAVSKTFVPAVGRTHNSEDVSVTQTVTFTGPFPTKCIEAILYGYQDGRLLHDGSQEFTVLDDVKWTVHIKENK